MCVYGCATGLQARIEPKASPEEISRAADRVIDMVAGARIIGLGEVTHGDGAIQRLRNAVVARAVEQLGCTSVVLENRFNRELYTDEFVRRVGPTAAMDTREFSERGGTVSTVEWAALLTWLRRHNDHADELVRVSGTDPCATAKSCAMTLASIVAPTSPADAKRVRLLSEGEPEAVRAGIEQWPIPPQTPARERATLARIKTLLAAGTFETRQSPAWRNRERIMADNVAWADQWSQGCVVVLAHAGHTDAKGGLRPDHPRWRYVKPMGEYLRERYGNEYRSVHFTFGRGDFLAHRTTLGMMSPRQLKRPPRRRVYRASKPHPGSIELALAHEANITVLSPNDLESLPRGPAWMRDVPFMWGWLGGLVEADWTTRSPGLAFDVLVYSPVAVPMVPLE